MAIYARNLLTKQEQFDLMIGRLDRILSEMVQEGRIVKSWREGGANPPYDQINHQTLKHHAEDMILAGKKILSDLGESCTV